MALSGALFASVSGLDTMSTAISVVGDNIANVNTPGFKARRPEFADVLGQTIASVSGVSQIGAGSKITRVNSLFTQGTFETTNRPTDVAIEGKGFFILDGPQGRFYTRAGIFNFDQEGYLTNAEGMRVQGFGIDPATQTSNGQLGDIQILSSAAPPRATNEIEMSANLDANAALGSFDPADPIGTSEHRVTLNVFDSMGNEHPVTFYFTKTAQSAGPPASATWTWNAAVDPSETTVPPAAAGDDVVVQGTGTLDFDENGVLTSAAGTSVDFQFAGGVATPQTVAIDFGPIAGSGDGDPTTQFAGSSVTNSFTQDGFASGSLQSLTIDREGFLTGLFSNGATLNIAQLSLASFPNVEGLRAVGNNNLIEARDSGQPLVGAPGTGRLGQIRSSSLEQSNVDLATEFVRLIINQRAFQANTRTISVTNELLANLVALGQ